MHLELRNRFKENNSRPGKYWEILMFYIMYSDKYGYSWVSQEMVCDKLGLDLQNYKTRYLKQLVKDGVLSVEVSPTFKKNPKKPLPKSTIYRINMARLPLPLPSKKRAIPITPRNKKSYPQGSVNLTLGAGSVNLTQTGSVNLTQTGSVNLTLQRDLKIYKEETALKNISEENPKTTSVGLAELAKMKAQFTNGKGH